MPLPMPGRDYRHRHIEGSWLPGAAVNSRTGEVWHSPRIRMCPAVFVVSRVPVAGIQITGEDTGHIVAGCRVILGRCKIGRARQLLLSTFPTERRAGPFVGPTISPTSLKAYDTTGRRKALLILCFFSAGREAAEQTILTFPAYIGGKRKAFSIRSTT